MVYPYKKKKKETCQFSTRLVSMSFIFLSLILNQFSINKMKNIFKLHFVFIGSMGFQSNFPEHATLILRYYTYSHLDYNRVVSKFINPNLQATIIFILPAYGHFLIFAAFLICFPATDDPHFYLVNSPIYQCSSYWPFLL